MRRWIAWGAGVLVLSIMLLAVLVFFRARIFYVRDGAIDVQRAETAMSLIIRLVGPARAEREMEREGRAVTPLDAHLIAHAFGAALYRAYGTDGFRWCTVAFAYGCYHELSGLAIAREGLSAVKELKGACDALPENDRFGCAHGIGHGVVASIGYTAPDLLKSLQRCHEIDPDIPRDGCTDGAIMEYDLRIMADGIGNLNPRPFTEHTAFSPCDVILPIDRYACYYESPGWWLASMTVGQKGGIKTDMMRRLCDSLAGADRRACFEGTGFWLASGLNFQTEPIRVACRDIGSAGTGDELSCLASAARRFRSMHRADVDTACAAFGLTGSALQYCNDVAHTSPLKDGSFVRPI